MHYRADNRNIETFKRDILSSHKTESIIALRLAILYKNNHGNWPEICPLGTSFDGTYVADSSVKTLSDYRIAGTCIEITTSFPLCKSIFHEKKAKIDRVFRGEYTMIFVNGYEVQEEPLFCLIKPSNVKDLIAKSKSKYGIVGQPARRSGYIPDKKNYRFDLDWFDTWYKLPKLIDNLPENYSFLTELL